MGHSGSIRASPCPVDVLSPIPCMGNEDDEVGNPMWGHLLPPRQGILSATDIARNAGIPEHVIQTAIEIMLKNGDLVPVLAPLCQRCGGVIEQYGTFYEIPDELSCPECHQHHHISELDIRVGYAVVREDGE